MAEDYVSLSKQDQGEVLEQAREKTGLDHHLRHRQKEENRQQRPFGSGSQSAQHAAVGNVFSPVKA